MVLSTIESCHFLPGALWEMFLNRTKIDDSNYFRSFYVIFCGSFDRIRFRFPIFLRHCGKIRLHENVHQAEGRGILGAFWREDTGRGWVKVMLGEMWRSGGVLRPKSK